MEIRGSKRLGSFGGYAFDEIDKAVLALREQRVEVTDFGVGDPRDPTPELVRRAGQAAIDRHAASGYPSYVGSRRYREAVADWSRRRFGVALDPATEICSTIGSKEAVFHFPEAFLDPGDVVLVPSPGYPPYTRGTRFAEGRVHYYPLDAETGFLPDLAAIPRDVARAARIFWLCNPNAPTGRVAPLAFLEDVVRFCADHEIILASDEAYSEIWFEGEPPHSALEVAKDGVVVVHSLSKRSAMTGWRVGWLAGDRRIVERFGKVKTNIDSGTPDFVQDAAVAALSDEVHVAEMRASYRQKRDLLLAAFAAAGLPTSPPEATLYIWQRAPEGMDGVALARRLLAPDVAAATMPGASLAEPLPDGRNPGADYVRFALVPTLEETKAAAERIAALRF